MLRFRQAQPTTTSPLVLAEVEVTKAQLAEFDFARVRLIRRLERRIRLLGLASGGLTVLGLSLFGVPILGMLYTPLIYFAWPAFFAKHLTPLLCPACLSI